MEVPWLNITLQKLDQYSMQINTHIPQGVKTGLVHRVFFPLLFLVVVITPVTELNF